MTASPSPAEGHIAELDDAIEAHRDSMRRVLRCAVLHMSPGETVLASDAHLRCRFGHWLTQHRDEIERADPVATMRVLEAHERMHDAARALCTDLLTGNRRIPVVLETFEATQTVLMAEIAHFRSAMLGRSAPHVALAGLPLREGLEEEFARCKALANRNGQLMVLIMAAVDHFNRVNVTLGSSVRDQALRHLASVWRAQAGADKPVFRMGGGEFLAILLVANESAAERAVDRLLQALRNAPLQLPDGLRLNLRVSAGLVVVESLELAAQAVARADAALHVARHSARDRWSWARCEARPLTPVAPGRRLLETKTLVIDDDSFALKLLAQQLDQLGCTGLTLCERTEDAISLLEASPTAVGLVFCDLQMPDIDGVEFVRHLARIGYSGSLVLVSGEHRRLLRAVTKLAQAHRIHILGALQKPVTREQLDNVLAGFTKRMPDALRAAETAFGPAELERAIAADELVLYYQPKVALTSGTLIGVESLVRWQHPRLGLVYPDRFIGLAEDHGLIDALTHAVLAAALRQSGRWRDAGLDLQVAVNVSMDNLAALDFPEVVARLAREAGVEPSRLILEVTESRLMKDARAPLDVLTRLRLKGVGLSIDDFGTGHSSLAQLRDLPFDELKLDRSFVSGAASDASLGAIVEATLAMARQLGLKVVAEGVEDQADWDYVRGHGCDVAQGYFIARPMPADDLPGWRAAWEMRSIELAAIAS